MSLEDMVLFLRWKVGDKLFRDDVITTDCRNEINVEDVKKLHIKLCEMDDTIYDIVTGKIGKMLRYDMESYIEAETYYEPYMEDYGSNGEYVIKEFCEKHGLKLIYYECDGSESGFESDSRW